MKKQNKVLIILIGILLIILISIVAAFLVENKKNQNATINENTNTTPSTNDAETEMSLPNTKYKELEVTDIAMEYFPDNDETAVTMTINNNTEDTVENEVFNTILTGKNGEILGQIEDTAIALVYAGSKEQVTIVDSGNLTSAKGIKLEEK